MAATPKDDAFAIASALSAAEAAHPNSPTLSALHETLRVGLYRHKAALNLSDDDVRDIDNLGPQRRGGGAKDPQPSVDGA